MTRIFGPTGARRRAFLGTIFSVLLIALFVAAPAQAVHDLGVFQLDGNANTTINPAPTALEDWDLICKANPVTAQRPNGCTFQSGYTVPSGTTKASPSSFVVDPSQSAIDDILKGGTKDDNDMNTWKWTSAKPSPPKNDATDAFAAEYTCKGTAPNSVSGCTGTTGDQLLYFGADRFSNNGSANIAFWFFQKSVHQQGNQPDGTCTISAGCPFVDKAGNPAHHKVGNVSLGGTTAGDILIISAFGPKAQIFVYEWVGAGNATKNYLGTNSCFTAACSLQPLFIGGADSDCPSVTGDNACALANDTSTASPWVLPQKTGGNNQFAPTDFFEGGLNLTELGVDACFSSFLINTRASAAGDAELHDKILGQFARCAPNLTTQVQKGGVNFNGEVTPGTPVNDTATVTVTGAANPDDPTGDVTFFLCPKATRTTCSTNIGTGTLIGGVNTTDGIATATSPTVNDSGQTGARGPLAPGDYCFRAEWPGDLNYDAPDPFTNDSSECFTVAKTPTSISTTQKWLPQDRATVSPAVAGTVVFSLYEGSLVCDGGVDATFTDTSAPFETDNTTYYTSSQNVSWSATFTPTDTNTYLGSTTTRCEASNVTITNDAGPFPPGP